MPLFSRKKGKKKSKLSIYDALAPSPAFVAMPSTPPLNTTLQSPNTQPRDHFTFTLPPQHHVLDTSGLSTAQHHVLDTSAPSTAQHHVLDTSAPSTAQHHVLDTSAPSTAQHHVLDTSAPSTAQHHVLDTSAPSTARDNQDGVAGESVYSLAGDYSDDDDGHGYATVRTTSFSRPRLSSPKQTLVTTLPPTHPTQAPSPKRTLSSSDLPSVTSALSIHSDSTNISYGLSPSLPSRTTHDNATPLHSSEIPAYQTRPNRRSPHKKSVQIEVHCEPDAEQHVEALYTKVKKPKKSSKEKAYVQNSRQPNVYHTLEPPTPHGQDNTPQSHKYKSTRNKRHSNGQSKRKSRSFDNLTASSKHVHSTQEHPQQRHHSASQYGHQAYPTLPDESSSSVESYLQSDEEMSHNYHQPRQIDLSTSLQLPNHRPPTSQHTHRQRRKSTGTLIDDPGTEILPIIQPNFIQQQGNVYVFSEQLPDGRVQYYSATPVQAHPPHSPTPPPASHPHTPTHSHPPPRHTRHNSPNLAESGYFSTNVLATGPTKPQLNTESIVISSADGASTLITPIATSTKEQCTHNHQASTQAKLLESSLNSAKATSSPFLHAAPRSIDDRDSPTELIAEYKSRETDFKARNMELEALNKEMKRENSTLKKQIDDITTQSDSHSDQVQCRLQSLSSENSVLCETNTTIQAKVALLESELSQVREELASLSDENQALLTRQQASLEEREEWERVASHAHSVLDENTSLLRAQEVLRETIRQLKGEHQVIVSELNNEVGELQREQRLREEALKYLRLSHTQLRARFDQLSARASRQVPLEEHQSLLMEMQRLVQELDDKNHRELKSQEVHLRISDKDKRYLVTKLTDAKAIIYQLEGEVAQMHKTHKRAHEKVMELQRELELARNREITMHTQLSKAVLCAEKSVSERDTFAKIARSQEQAKERAVVRGAKKEASIGKRMETHMLEQASEILHEQDKDHRHQREQYRQEISHLKSLLAKKQTFVDKLISHK